MLHSFSSTIFQQKILFDSPKSFKRDVRTKNFTSIAPKLQATCITNMFKRLKMMMNLKEYKYKKHFKKDLFTTVGDNRYFFEYIFNIFN